MENKKNIWKILTIIFGIMLVVSWVNMFGGVSKTEAQTKVQNYLDQLPLDGSITAGEVIKEHGLYKVNIDVAGENVEGYITKDGDLLFTGIIELSTTPITGSTTQEQEPTEIPKTEKPEVKLFVMSQCPFGTIAESAIYPVLNLLKDKFNFNLDFIANENQDETFSSLHGQPEVDEDTRQLCVIKHYPDTYMEYISCINEDYQNLPWESCLNKNGMDTNKIKECYTGDEGKGLLRENIKEAEKYRVGGSPTLIINDVKYQGQRTPEAYKQAICSAFTSEPEECTETLVNTATTTTGSC